MFASYAGASLFFAASLAPLVGALAVTPRDPAGATINFRRSLLGTSFKDVVSQDTSRVKAFRERQGGGHTGKRASSISATNVAVIYTAQVGIGSPPTEYTLLIDTGSSNTWVGAGKKYVETSTSKNTLRPVEVTYGSGFFAGFEYTDTVSLSSSLTVTNQSIGVADTASGFTGYDGILGIGPVGLTDGTVLLAGNVPTITDNLFTQKKISQDVIGIYFAPTTTQSNANGELTFGGIDTSKTTSTISYVPITTVSPASEYWGIDQSISYGSSSILSSTAGIVDTGTTLVMIASDAFDEYQTATGATADSTTGLLTITAAQYKALKPLNFVIGGKTFALSPNAQIFPRSLNTELGGTADGIYLIVASTGEASGSGLDFINGYTFLERFYSVFDTTNKRIGFATTAKTDATSN